MQLQQLRYFLAVAEHGSFTKAASELFVAQPSVSQQIRQLEAELGVQLLDRSNRVVTPTQIGERLLNHAHMVLDRVRDMEREAADYSGLVFGTLRVGTTPTASRVLLPKSLPAFTRKYPDIAIDVVEGGSLEIADLVGSGSLDLGLVASSPRLGYVYHGFKTTLLATGVVACYVADDNPIASRDQIALSMLRNERIIAFGSGYLVDQLVREAADWDISAKTVYTTDNTDSARLMVAAGLGITFSSSLARDIRTDEGVRLVPIHRPRLPFCVTAISFGERYLPRAAASFLESLQRLVDRD